MRAESEYHRFGTLAYLAAYDVHRAGVIGRCDLNRLLARISQHDRHAPHPLAA